MARFTGQVDPTIPSTAPMSYRLSSEVYALDGVTNCYTGPAIGSQGRGHLHQVACGDGDYMLAPGARLEVGSGGKLYETMGAYPGGKTGMYIAGAVGVAAVWWLFFRKEKR